MRNTMDTTLLQMALIGYEAERQKIQGKIAEIQRRLNGRTRTATPTAVTASGKRTRKPMSAAARKRIADAQKKRWAAYHKKNA